MIRILSRLLSDSESLFEYERYGIGECRISCEQILCRLVANERRTNPYRSDAYYDGLGNYSLQEYKHKIDLLVDLPYRLSCQHLMRKEGYIFVDAGHLDSWCGLLAYIPPSLFIAAFVMDEFTEDMTGNKIAVYRFVSRHLEQFRYTAQPITYLDDLNYLIKQKNGLHDLHIHLNGSTESDIVWHYMLHNAAETVMQFTDAYQKKSDVRKLAEQIISDFTPITLEKRLMTAAYLRNLILVGVASGVNLLQVNNRRTLMSFARKGLSVQDLWADFFESNVLSPMLDEIMLTVLVLCELRRHRNEWLAGIFHHYLLIKGMVHRFIVMQKEQVRFTQFQLITENTFRHGVEAYYKQRFMQLAGGGPLNYLGIVEGRFSPKASCAENLRLIRKIEDGFRKAKEECRWMKNTHLVLIAHFIKQKEQTADRQLSIRHWKLRNELQIKALALAATIQVSSIARKMVVGIDAAASEFDAGPEVFAPAFHFLRKHGVRHVTFHVGEDFRHLLSGLRFIYEATDFLELRRGDRLGHCTAVGIPPALWKERNGEFCVLPQGEWLDNLVFAWMLIGEQRDADLTKYLFLLEREIAEYSNKIYDWSVLPYKLVEAWRLRKHDPFLYLEKGTASMMNEWDWIETAEEMQSVRNALANDHELMKIWKIYHRMVAGKEDKYDNLVKINVDQCIPVELMEVLQNVILEKMSKGGIVIESLPTSNLCISYYRQLDEYHLERWLNTQHTTLMPPVVLGTDDPGIFTTNLYNEYARVYSLLESKKYSAVERMEKLAAIHQNSVIYNFTNHD